MLSKMCLLHMIAGQVVPQKILGWKMRGVVLETVKVTGSHTSEAKDQIDLSL